MKEQERVNSAAFRSGVHKAKVIAIPGAKHYVFLSNEDEVLQAIEDFASRTQ